MNKNKSKSNSHQQSPDQKERISTSRRRVQRDSWRFSCWGTDHWRPCPGPPDSCPRSGRWWTAAGWLTSLSSSSPALYEGGAVLCESPGCTSVWTCTQESCNNFEGLGEINFQGRKFVLDSVGQFLNVESTRCCLTLFLSIWNRCVTC